MISKAPVILSDMRQFFFAKLNCRNIFVLSKVSRKFILNYIRGL